VLWRNSSIVGKSFVLVLILLVLVLPLYAVASPRVVLQLSAPENNQGVYSLNDCPTLQIDFYNYPKNTPYFWTMVSPDGKKLKTNELIKTENRLHFLQLRSVSLAALLGEGSGKWTIQLEHQGIVLCEITFQFDDWGKQFDYLSYVPRSFKAGNGALIAIHGAGRSPASVEGHLRFFKPIADELGRVLIVPYFSNDRFKTYQVVFEDRADIQLQTILLNLATKYNFDADNLFFWWHSGGGQFVHRYMMFYPQGISKAIISGAGWFTFPVFTHPYPAGIGKGSIPFGLTFLAQDFSKIDTLLIVGKDDNQPGEDFVTGSWVDWQGSNRVERMKFWMEEMSSYLVRNNYIPKLELEIVNANHGNTREISESLILNFFSGKNRNTLKR